jgi:O-antigen ligase
VLKLNKMIFLIIITFGSLVGFIVTEIRLLFIFLSLLLFVITFILSYKNIHFWLISYLISFILIPSIEISKVSVTLTEVFFLIGIFIFITRFKLIQINNINIYTFLFIFLAIISAMVSLKFNPEMAIISFLYILKICEITLPLFLLSTYRNIKLDFIFRSVIFLSVISALIGITLFLFQVPVDDKTVWLGTSKFYRLAGIFYEANQFGYFTATISLVIILILISNFYKKKILSPFILYLFLGVLLTTTIFTFSRTALIYIIFGVLLSMFINKKIKFNTLFNTLAIIIISFLFIYFINNKLFLLFYERISSTILQGFNDFNSISGGRVETWSYVNETLILSPLFGIGYKTFLIYSETFLNGARAMDNNYLSILVEMGVFGFLVFIALNVSILLTLRKAIKNQIRYADVLYIVWSSTLITMFFIDTFSFWRSLGVLFICIGSVVYNRKDSKEGYYES